MTVTQLRTLLVTILVGAAALTATSPTAQADTDPVAAAHADARRAGSNDPRVREWIAYESTSYRIRLVRPDGSGDHALEDVTVGPEDNPDWSPDGRRITFVGEGTDAMSAPGLWIVNANGRGLRRLVRCTAPCQYLDDPAWSPDGRSIAYSRQAPDATRGGTVEAVDVATGRTRTLLAAAPGDFYAGVRWSPDGMSLVLEWVHASPTNYDDVTDVTLARADIGGSNPVPFPLTESGVFPQTADWAPSGDYISYASLPTADALATDVYLIRSDGTGRTRLTTLRGFGGVHTDFTNDSEGVYFVELTATGPELRLVDIATRLVTPVGSPAVAGFHPRTRPDAVAGDPLTP